MEFEKVAHMVVFGETYTGKTYYTKYLLDILKPDRVYVFTGSPHEWDNPKYIVYTEDFDNNAVSLMDDCSKIMDDKRTSVDFEPHCPHIVIFDDFNEEINTKSNEIYKSLYTRGRHKGIRVINLAHQSHNIGPTARANARYIFILSSTSEAEVESLAELFYGKNHIQLKKIVKDAYNKNPYNCVVLDKRTKQFKIDIAPAPTTLTHNTHNVEISTELPSNSLLGSNPASATYFGVGNPIGPAMTTNIGTKNAHNMYDNSINNFNINHNIKMKQMLETNNTHNEIKLQNLIFERELRLKEDIMTAGDIINKSFKTPEDIMKIVKILNQSLRPSPPFTALDYKEGIPVFMNKYHNREYKPSNTQNIIESAGSMIMSGNDTLGLASSGWNFFNAAFSMKQNDKYDKILNQLEQKNNIPSRSHSKRIKM